MVHTLFLTNLLNFNPTKYMAYRVYKRLKISKLATIVKSP